jgi:histidinol phosphatase-like enzyme
MDQTFGYFETQYSDNWIDLDTLLVYKSPDFKFRPNVIITELDGCLINHITTYQIYTKKYTFDIFNEEFLGRLKKSDYSIVVISNQINNNKLITDMVKRKTEFLASLGISIIVMFPIKPNYFMKPHTGCWRLINAYYRKHGREISSVLVVSNEGGLLVTNGKKEIHTSDIDRAFAHNIGGTYKSIDEFLDSSIEVPYAYDKNIIDPNIRNIYCEYLEKTPRVDVFDELQKFGNREFYIIMIMGPPRCGKTTLAKTIENIDPWSLF